MAFYCPFRSAAEATIGNELAEALSADAAEVQEVEYERGENNFHCPIPIQSAIASVQPIIHKAPLKNSKAVKANAEPAMLRLPIVDTSYYFAIILPSYRLT